MLCRIPILLCCCLLGCFFTGAAREHIQPSYTPSAVSILLEGNDFYRNRYYAGAHEKYMQAFASDSTLLQDPFVTLKFGMTNYHMNEFRSAIRYLQSAHSELPEDLQPYVEYFLARALHENGQYEAAIEAYRLFEGRYKNHVLYNSVRLSRAESFEKLHMWPEAIRVYRLLLKARDMRSQRVNIYNRIAAASLQDKNYKESLRSYLDLQKKYPGNRLAYNAIDSILIVHRRTQQPLKHDVLWKQIDIATRHREFAQSLPLIQQYRQLYPQGKYRGEVLYNEGYAYYYSQRYQDAYHVLDGIQNITKSPKPIRQAHLLRCRSLLRLGRAKEAVKKYEEFIRRYPRDPIVPEVYWKLGWIAEGEKRFTDAIANYSKLTTFRNDFRERSVFRVGLNAYKAGQYQQAVEAFQRGEQPRYSDFMQHACTFWKGQSLTKLPESQSARTVFQRLRNMPFPDYYAFRSAEILGQSIAYTAPAGQGQHGSSFSFQKPFTTGVLIGELFGTTYGEQVLAQQSTKESHTKMYHWQHIEAYELLTAYDQAIRSAIRYRRKYITEDSMEGFGPLITKLYPFHYQPHIETFSARYDIDPFLVLGLIRRESLFESDAISVVGAAGLMQLMPYTGRSAAKLAGVTSYAWEDLLRPEINLRLGMAHFNHLLKLFDGDLIPAVASYNAGLGIVKEWIRRYTLDDELLFIESIEFSETRTYVKKVLEGYWIYQLLYQAENSRPAGY